MSLGLKEFWDMEEQEAAGYDDGVWRTVLSTTKRLREELGEFFWGELIKVPTVVFLIQQLKNNEISQGTFWVGCELSEKRLSEYVLVCLGEEKIKELIKELKA